MKEYTVTFFGHRNLDNPYQVESQLYKIIRLLLEEKTYVLFLVGRNGEFDQCVSSTIRQAKKVYGNENSSLILVLPYSTAEYRSNELSYHAYYDDVEIIAQTGHPKAAIYARNRAMIHRADLVICFVNKSFGGAYQAIRYAKKQGKKIINLANSD